MHAEILDFLRCQEIQGLSTAAFLHSIQYKIPNLPFALHMSWSLIMMPTLSLGEYLLLCDSQVKNKFNVISDAPPSTPLQDLDQKLCSLKPISSDKNLPTFSPFL